MQSNQKEKHNRIIDGKYELIRKLQTGGTGRVFLVKSLGDGKTYALKTIAEKYHEDDLKTSGIFQEFRYLKKLNHPNIVRVIDFGIDDQFSEYLILEYVQGKPIDKHFQKKDINPDSIYEAFIQILNALSYIHEAGILHGDISPSNILVEKTKSEPYFRIKVTDFGFAAYQTDYKFSSEKSTVIKGSALFIPPELLLGHPPDERSDLYSVGITIYKVITGKAPFRGQDFRSLFTSILETRLTFNHLENKGYDDKFCQLLQQITSKEPGLRPTSLSDALEFMQGFSPIKDLRESISVSKTVKLYNPGFIGRKPLLKVWKQKLKQLKKEIPGMVVITGDKGLGKSRTLEQLEYMTVEKGIPVKLIKFTSNSEESYLIRQLTGISPFAKSDHPGLTREMFDSNAPSFFQSFLHEYFKNSDDSQEVFLDRTPRVILLDDCQYGDLVSLKFIHHLCFWAQDLKILVAATCEKKGEIEVKNPITLMVGSKKSDIRNVKLQLFSLNELKQLLSDTFGRYNPSEELSNRIYSITEGIPLHALEFLKYLIEQDALRIQTDQIVLRQKYLKQKGLPYTIDHLYRSRWDLLTEEMQKIMGVMALIRFPCRSTWLIAFFKEQNGIPVLIRELRKGNFVEPTLGKRQEFLQKDPFQLWSLCRERQ